MGIRRLAAWNLWLLVASQTFGATFTGTGFFVNSHGYMATNFHVIEGGKQIEVVTSDGKSSPAQVVLTDPTNDLAIIKVGVAESVPLAIRDSAATRKGDSVFTIGFPKPGIQGRESKVTEGIISSLTGLKNQPTLFQHSIPTQGGNSGGPIIDKVNGLVVGVIVAKLSGDQQLVNYGVKSGMLLNLISSIPNIADKPQSAAKRVSKSFPDLVAASEKSIGLIIVTTGEPPSSARNSTQSASAGSQGEPSKFEVVAQALANYEKGLAAYREKRFGDALLLFGKSGEAGNDRAQTLVGAMFEEGKVGAPDFAEAAKWYKKAADQGNADAQAWLADLYRRGQGVTKDLDEAAGWYKKSIAQGNSNGMYGYGMLYEVATNHTEAFRWLRAAADKNNIQAQYMVGRFHEIGNGMPKDEREARVWYGKAAAQNHAQSKDALLRLDQPNAVKAQAKPALPPDTPAAGAAAGGSAQAAKDTYDRGRLAYDKANYGEALAIFRPAAEQGNANAQNMIGIMFVKGQGQLKDDQEATKWFKLAAQQGHAAAQSNLAYRLYDGLGTTRNQIAGYMWAVLAVEKGATSAQKLVDKLKNSEAQPLVNTVEAFAGECRKQTFKNCGP